MPRDAARKKATRAYQARHPGLGYREAAAAVALIDQPPAAEVLCETCSWTTDMACPECPGCGCYTGRCSGWRHAEFEDEHDDDERNGDDERGDW